MGKAGPPSQSNVAFPVALAILSEQAKDYLGLVPGSGTPPHQHNKLASQKTDLPRVFWKPLASGNLKNDTSPPINL